MSDYFCVDCVYYHPPTFYASRSCSSPLLPPDCVTGMRVSEPRETHGGEFCSFEHTPPRTPSPQVVVVADGPAAKRRWLW